MPNEFIARNGIIALNNSTITGSLNVSGNITTPGTLTVQTIVAQTITSSTSWMTGSTKFGNTVDNTHQFTGSILQSGSLAYFAGSVGIGTASPLVKLDLRGDEYVSGYLVGFDVNPLSNYAYRFTNDGGNSFINVVGGNLGIGTTSAPAKLHIKASGASTGLTFQLTDSSNNQNFYVFDGGRAGMQYYPFTIAMSSSVAPTGNAYFQIGSTGVLYVSASGNVGIGTTSPTGKLDVSPGGTVTAGDLVVDTANKTVYVGRASGTDNDNSVFIVRDRVGTTKFYVAGGSGTNSYFSAGNVGIGTTTPAVKLDVNGSINLSNGSNLTWGGAYGANIPTISGYNSELYFYPAGSTSGEKVRINSSGNVGIGTTSPSYKLHISGNLYVDHNDAPIATFVRSGGTNANTVIAFTNATTSTYIGSNGTLFGLGGSTGAVSNNPFIIEPSATEKIRLTSDGSVGIGTTSPPSKFTVSNAGAEGIELKPADSAGVSRILFFNRSDSTRDDAQYDALTHQFQVNTGTEAMRITSGGNVGIGTTSPTTTLHVRTDTGVLIKGASSTTDAILSLIPASGGRQYDFRNYGSSFGIKDNSADVIRLFFHYDGNTGIGTTAPTAKLDILGPDGSVGTVRWANAGGRKAGFLYSDSVGVGIYDTNLADAGIYLAGNTQIDFRVNGSQRMLINSSGNVGIGTTSPAYPLHVYGGTDVARFQSNSNTAAWVQIKAGTTGDSWQIGPYNGGLNFYNDNSTSYRVYFKNDGNVGIGTTSPTRKLDVNGTSIFRDFTTVVSTNGNAVSNITWLSTDSGIMNIYTGGSSTVQLNSNGVSYINGGSVGIGTTSPASTYVLDVRGGNILFNNANVNVVAKDTGTGYATYVAQSQNGSGGILDLAAQGSTANSLMNGAPANAGVVGMRGSHELHFGTGATSRMMINTNGSVGIGTTSPSALLHVSSSGTDNNIIGRRIYASGTGTGSGFTLNSTLIYQSSGGEFNITNPGSYPNVAFTIDTGGNVGIGTTSPITKLHVVGNIAVNATNLGTWSAHNVVRISSIMGLWSDATADGVASNAYYNNNWYRLTTGDAVNYQQRTGDGTGNHIFQVAGYGAANSAITWTDALTILNGGNVGIGTTSPLRTLHVRGGAGTAQIQSTSTTSIMYFGDTNSSVIDNQGFGSAGNSLWFMTGGSERMRIDSGGNVGIGTTTPSYKLHVVGSIYTSTSLTTAGPITVGMAPAPFWNAKFVDYSDGSGVYIGSVQAGGYKYIAGESYYNNSSYWYSDFTTSTAIGLGGGILKFYTDSGLTANTNFIPTERMRITAGGNVGIGTTSPATKLHIYDSSATNMISVQNSGGSGASTIGNDSSGNLYIKSPSNIYFQALSGTNSTIIGTAGQIILNSSSNTTFTGAGNVGIGTTSPSEGKLVVANSGPSVIYNKETSVGVNSLWNASDGSIVQFGVISNHPLLILTNNTERMRITSGGEVVVNGTTPIYTAANRGNITLSGTSGILSFSISSANSGYVYHTGTNMELWNAANGYLLFATNNAERMRITSGGNVFVGSQNTLGLSLQRLTVTEDSSAAFLGIYRNNTATSQEQGGIQWMNGGAGTSIAKIAVNTSSDFTDTGNILFFTRASGGSQTERMRITSGGNVGIGTTSPGARFHINGSNNSVLPLLVNGADSGEGMVAKFSRGDSEKNFYISAISNQFIHLATEGSFKFITNTFVNQPYTSGTTVMTITSGGNVGIGTTSPGYLLHVSTAVAANFSLEQSSTNANYTTFVSNGVARAYIGVENSAGTGLFGSNDAYGMSIGTPTATGFNIATNNTIRLRINSSGNVGIGTTSPLGRLYLGASALASSGDASDALNIKQTSTTAATGIYLERSGEQKGYYIYIGGSVDSLTFQRNNAGTKANVMSLTRDGLVGIGTTTPVSSNLDGALTIWKTYGGDGSTTPSPTAQTYYENQSGLYVFGRNSTITLVGANNENNEIFFANASSRNYAVIGTLTGTTTAGGDMYFRTGGNNEAMRITTGGLVGIGTTSPTGRLNVISAGSTGFTPSAVGPIGGSANTRFHFQGNEPGIMLSSDISPTAGTQTGAQAYQLGLQIGLYGTNDVRNQIYFGNAPLTFVYSANQGGAVSERMRIDIGGNVGIGTTSPLNALEVGANGNIKLKGGAVSFDNSPNTHTFSISVNTSPALIFTDVSNATERMRIDSAGNVGIGTTSLTTNNGGVARILKLGGAGNIAIIGESSTTNTGITIESRRTSRGTSARNSQITIGGDASDNGEIRFYTAPGSSDVVDRMIINSAGNVGIGTTSPSYLLDVSGTIRATGDVIAYSDARVKDNVETITDALTKVTSLRGVSYTRKDSEDKSRKVGVIAQEVLDILPEVVQQDDSGNYSVAYGNIVGVLIEAIKELKAEINELKNNK